MIIGIAKILVVNMNPIIIAKIPARKLNPSAVEAKAILKTGHMINIKPNIIESIPMILLFSIFSPL